MTRGTHISWCLETILLAECRHLPSQIRNYNSGREIGRSLHEIFNSWAITLRSRPSVLIQALKWSMLPAKYPESWATPYHPQSNGLVERFNRTLLYMQATSAKDHPLDWENCIRQVYMAWNTSVQSSTGYTQLYLMFRWQAWIPDDSISNARTSQTPGEYATIL